MLTLGAEFPDIGKDLTITVVGAVLGFLAAIVTEQIKRRREPQKRLTWHATTRNADISLDEEFRRRVSISFDGTQVQDLSSVDFTLVNAGNTVVREHQLRFEFPEGCRVLEAEVHPEPEREMGVMRRRDLEVNHREAVFTIRHFERGRSAGFRIMAAGSDAASWKSISHNESGDVEYQEGSSARAADDSKHVPQFLMLLFLMLALPPVISSISNLIDYDLGEPLGTIVRICFIIALLPTLPPTFRFTREVLSSFRTGNREEPTRIEVHGGSSNVIYGREMRHVNISLDGQESGQLLSSARRTPTVPLEETAEQDEAQSIGCVGGQL